MRRMMIRGVVGLILAVVPIAAAAQTLSESVTVEGRFMPDIIAADRLALLPTAVQLVAPESPMTYDRSGVIANFAPDALNLPATRWGMKRMYDASRGYVDFSIGSWLNASLSAGYLAVNNADTRLSVYLQHKSTSLWQAWKYDEASRRPGADPRYRYDEVIGAELQHKLFGAGSLTGDFRYHLGYFNYYGTTDGPSVTDDHIVAPTQTLNDVYAHAGWNGTGTERLKYRADADVRYFGFRAVYVPLFTDQYPKQFMQDEGGRETAVNVGGDVRYSLSDDNGNGSAVGGSLRYSGVLNSVGNDVNRAELTPAYTLTGRNYTLRLGANLAVVGNGVKNRFRVAPDVQFSARKGIYAINLKIGGGTHLRTLAWHYYMDYYSNPVDGCYQAAYTPIDACVAFQLNPGGKWTFGLEWEWRTTLDESFGGLYQAFLNGGLISNDIYTMSGKIHGFSVRINAGYEFCRYLTLNGKASWQPQDEKSGFLNGFDMPEFTADLSAESRPIEKLKIALTYGLRAKRFLLPGNMSRLDLGGEYRITDKLSVGAELKNLLNRHEEMLPGLPLEGFNAAGGVNIKF